MNDAATASQERDYQRKALEAAIRIGLVFLLTLFCFNIIQPFILLTLWGAILAVAVHPFFLKWRDALGGRSKLAATSMTLLALSIVVVPSVLLSGSAVESWENVARRMQEGTLEVPPPPADVKDWPLIGERVHEAWSQASTNLSEAASKYKEQLKGMAKWLLGRAAGVGGALLQCVVAIIIAGILLVSAKSGTAAIERILERLVGQPGARNLVTLSGATIRSVAQGVLGVAVIQAVAAALGMLLVGVPYAGLWTLMVLFLAIIQVPTILVLGPIMVWAFGAVSTVPAVAFTVWSLLVGVSDSFLKPILLGRGLDVPMLVILLGAIGGMIRYGIIGLFVGAVVLAVGYKLLLAWLGKEIREETPAS